MGSFLVNQYEKRVKHRNKNYFDYRKSNLYYGNIYHDKGKYYEVECFNYDTFLIDKQDYEICKPYVWHINYDKTGYKSVTTKINGRMIKLHRLLLNCLDSKIEIDHINRDSTDNRRSNLRFANRSINNFNKSLQSNNTSGHKGIYKTKNYNKWLVQIGCDGKRYYIGSYNTLDEAIQARNNAEYMYYSKIV